MIAFCFLIATIMIFAVGLAATVCELRDLKVEIERLKNRATIQDARLEMLTSGLDMLYASYFREKDQHFGEVIQ